MLFEVNNHICSSVVIGNETKVLKKKLLFKINNKFRSLLLQYQFDNFVSIIFCRQSLFFLTTLSANGKNNSILLITNNLQIISVILLLIKYNLFCFHYSFTTLFLFFFCYQSFTSILNYITIYFKKCLMFLVYYLQTRYDLVKVRLRKIKFIQKNCAACKFLN